jgi:hypothetical protein
VFRCGHGRRGWSAAPPTLTRCCYKDRSRHSFAPFPPSAATSFLLFWPSLPPVESVAACCPPCAEQHRPRLATRSTTTSSSVAPSSTTASSFPSPQRRPVPHCNHPARTTTPGTDPRPTPCSARSLVLPHCTAPAHHQACYPYLHLAAFFIGKKQGHAVLRSIEPGDCGHYFAAWTRPSRRAARHRTEPSTLRTQP